MALLHGRLAFEQGTSLVVVGALEAPRFAVANEAWMVVAHQSMYPHYNVAGKIHSGHYNVSQNSGASGIVMLGG